MNFYEKEIKEIEEELFCVNSQIEIAKTNNKDFSFLVRKNKNLKFFKSK